MILVMPLYARAYRVSTDRVYERVVYEHIELPRRQVHPSAATQFGEHPDKSVFADFNAPTAYLHLPASSSSNSSAVLIPYFAYFKATHAASPRVSKCSFSANSREPVALFMYQT